MKKDIRNNKFELAIKLLRKLQYLKTINTKDFVAMRNKFNNVKINKKAEGVPDDGTDYCYSI